MATTEAALWQQRFLRFALGGGAPIVGGVFSVLRNKWLAFHLEASGLGVLAQVIAGQNWLGTLTGLGAGLPVARAVGAATAAGDDAAVRRTTWTALTLVGGFALVVAAVGLWLAPGISRTLLGTAEHATLVRLSMVGVAGLAVHGVAQGLFAGRSDVRGPLTLALAGGAAALGTTLLLVPRAGLVGGQIGATVLFPAAVLGAWLVHRRGYARALVPAPRPRFDPAKARELLGVGSAALLLALVDQGTMLGLRSHYLRENGIAANGLLQSALALAQQLGGLFYAYLTGYAFGKISGAGGAAGAAEYTRRQWNPLMVLAALACAIAMALAAPLLHLFYSSRFVEARPMLAWTLLGEYARIGGQVWALGALPVGGIALWVPIGLATTLALAIAYAGFAGAGAGPLSLPLAYATGNLATLAFVAVWMGRRGVRLGPLQIAVTLVALAGLALAAARITVPAS